MHVSNRSKLTSNIDGETYYFCSSSCKIQFTEPEREQEILRRRLIVAWILAVPILLINYLLNISFLEKGILMLFLAIPIQFYSGIGFYSGAKMALLERSGNMDLLVSIGSTVAFIFSIIIIIFRNYFTGEPLFFDASSMIFTLILTGSYIESRTKSLATRSAESLKNLIPQTVTRLTSGKEEVIGSGDVLIGDLLLIKPGNIIPVDGIIVSGISEVDNSIITGEQIPLQIGSGNHVNSGSINLNGVLTVRAEKIGKETTIMQIRSMIQRASMGHFKVQRMADLFSSIFIKIVFLVATASFIFWFLYLHAISSDYFITVPVLAFVSVIVIACPCAIGLAAPITLLISSSIASKNGIVIKNSSCLERLSKTDTIIFDKTGTLTSDLPSVTNYEDLYQIQNFDNRSIIYSVESKSIHPIARAIVKYIENQNDPKIEIENFMELPGVGVEAEYKGHRIQVSRTRVQSKTSVSLFVDDIECARIYLEYEVRSSAVMEIEALKKLNKNLVILSGDSELESRRIGTLLGIQNIFSNLKPDEKQDIIQKYQSEGHFVTFLGDGINDSPSLETADVGIAMGSGSDIARETGDILLLNNDLRSMELILSIGTLSIKKIRENLFWAVGYNSLLIPLAAGILVPIFNLSVFFVMPVFAALAMGLSSSSVVLNSLRMRNSFKKMTSTQGIKWNI